MILDGCYAKSAAGEFAFLPGEGLTALDAAETLQHVQAGITHLVERWRRDDAGWMDDAPATSALAAASVQNAVAPGGRVGQSVARMGEPRDVEDAADVSAERCHAQWDGFDLDD